MEKLPLLQNIENNKLTIIIVDCSDYTQEMILSIQSFILEIPIGSNIAMVCRHGPVSGVRYPNRYCSGNINKKGIWYSSLHSNCVSCSKFIYTSRYKRIVSNIWKI